MNLSCPQPIKKYPKVLLAHGGGGELTRKLITQIIIPKLQNELLSPLGDSAIIQTKSNRIAMTTDAYVVSPIFFPGGSIGDLAVNGTINDLAVSGATPLALSLALVIEEGCDMQVLETVINHIATAAKTAHVSIATGDTKVVERGKCDQLYVITTGIGSVPDDIQLGTKYIRPGDQIIINGSIGDHGVAVMTARDHFEFDSPPHSDTAPLYELINSVISANMRVRFMRDPTRGGVAAVLNEIAKDCGFNLLLNEVSIPVNNQVKSACTLLGLDPIHIANEGKVIMIVDPRDAEKTLSILKKHPFGQTAAIIGEVTADKNHQVIMHTRIGSDRLIHPISGEQLPRIC